MRFQVPQFIEIESKIFGPLTLKQFIYLIGGGGIIFILYALLPFWLMIIFAKDFNTKEKTFGWEVLQLRG